MFSNAESVYQRVLGADFDTLTPALRRYFGPLPEGAVGCGAGRYDTVGPRLPLLRPILWMCAGRDVLFPERGTDVPFSIENRSDGDALTAIRRFHFPNRERRMRDRLEVRHGGLLVDRLGRRGGFEVTLEARVVDGGMRLMSTSLAWRLRSVRVPLPPVAQVTVSESSEGERQRVDVRIRVRLLGEVFRYAGDFVYRVEAPRVGVGGRP